MYFFISNISPETTVFIINCSIEMKIGNAYYLYNNISDIPLKNILLFLKYKRQITANEKSEIKTMWEKLIAEKGNLRVIHNGRLKTVDASFYDEYILKSVAVKQKKIADVIGEIIGCLSRNSTTVDDGFLAKRIENLVESGTLKQVGNNERFFGNSIKFVG